MLVTFLDRVSGKDFSEKLKLANHKGEGGNKGQV
jgi:hypothetical protein